MKLLGYKLIRASCSALSVTVFYDSQLVYKVAILNNLIDLLECRIALEKILTIHIKQTQRKNAHNLSEMPNRRPWIPVMLMFHSHTTDPFLRDQAISTKLLTKLIRKRDNIITLFSHHYGVMR